MIEDNWHRIEKIVKWTGLSVNAFARAIGLNRSENLYQIKRGNNGVSRELAETITKKYPNISKAWLLTGEGEMFVDEAAIRGKYIPMYYVDAARLMEAGNSIEPSMQLRVLLDCDFACLSMSRTMVPDIPQGAVILCKQVDRSFIMPGRDYLIVSTVFTGVTTLRREPLSDSIRLVPRNTAEFDEMIININEIRKLYRIQGVFIDKSQ